MRRFGARWILLVLLGVTSCSTVLLVLRCSRHIDELDVLTAARNQPVPRAHLSSIEGQGRLLLPGNVHDVQKSGGSMELHRIRERIVDIVQRSQNITSAVHNLTDIGSVNQYVQLLDNIQRAAKLLVEPVSYKNEFEVVPYTRFVSNRAYPVDPGLGRRVVEKLIGYRKLEMHIAMQHAVNSIAQQTGQRFSASNFIEGIYRAVPSIGTQYELYFRDKMQYRKVVIALPNSLPLVVRDETFPVQKDVVHIIIALSQRVDAFEQFLKRFEQLIPQDNNVDLTVVYFGHVADHLKMQSLVKKFNSQYNSDKVHLLVKTDKFSRGKGLQIGADSLQNNSLLFLCDVDIVFTGSFLERCRLHTSPGQSVYYPIVFSLYNPAVMAQLGHTVRSPEKPVVTRGAGFWRDFGYGMTCQYRADFLSVQGFRDKDTISRSVAGWGLEDVRLYRKHLTSGSVNVVRATDPGIFHIWHEKMCPRNLSEEQYKGCLRSRALSEASHAQLGMLLLQRTTQTPP